MQNLNQFEIVKQNELEQVQGGVGLLIVIGGKIYKVKASVSDDLPYLENGKTFEGQVGKDNYLKTFKVQ